MRYRAARFAAAVVVLLAVGSAVLAQESRTITVQPGESIQRAIDAAEAGDVIVIAAGTYAEDLIVTKPLSLTGEGRESVIVVGNVVIRQAHDIALSGMTITPQRTAGLGKPTIQIEGSREVRLSGILVERPGSAAGGPGLIVGEWSQVEVTESLFRQSMVMSFPQAEVILTECQLIETFIRADQPDYLYITRSTVSGSVTVHGGHFLLVDSTIRAKGLCGVFTYGCASVMIIGAMIQATGCECGISLKDIAAAVVQESRIGGSRYFGIHVSGESFVTLKDNEVADNAGYGVIAYFPAEVRGEGNRMFGNGVDLGGNVPGSLRIPLMPATEGEIVYPDPRFPTLQEAVDALIPGGKLILSGEHEAGITVGKEIALVAEEEGTVTLRARGPRAAVVSLTGGAQATIEGLLLTGGDIGVLLGADAVGLISGCTLSRNHQGISVFGRARATITRSVVKESWDGGVHLRDVANVTMLDSVVSGNFVMGGITVGGAAQLLLEGNRIEGQRMGHGVSVYTKPCHSMDTLFTGRIVGRGNTFHNNAWGDFCPADLAFLATEEGGEYTLAGVKPLQ